MTKICIKTETKEYLFLTQSTHARSTLKLCLGETCVKALHARPLPNVSLERRHEKAEQMQAGQEEVQDCTRGKAEGTTTSPDWLGQEEK